MADGVLRRGVSGHAQNIDVDWSAGKPFAQPAGDRLAIALA
jgi:hypothetical protein